MMDQETKDLFINEIAAVCKKYGVVILSGADAADDTNLSSWLEVCEVKTPWPCLFECDQIGPNGID